MIDAAVLRQLKKRAAEEGRTLQAVTNELLRRGLTPGRPGPFRLDLPSWETSVQPGVDLSDRDVLFDLMDGRA
jgi:hypothetical protein